jgi:hypothetical protein
MLKRRGRTRQLRNEDIIWTVPLPVRQPERGGGAVAQPMRHVD